MISWSDPMTAIQTARHWAVLFPPLTIKCCLVLGLLFLATRLMRRSSAAARHLLWAIGLASLLLLPFLEAALPAWRVVPLPDLTQRPTAVQPASLTNPTRLDQAPAPVAFSVARERPEQGAAQPRDDEARSPLRAAAAASASVTRVHTVVDLVALLPAEVWLFLIWLWGLILMGCLFLRGLRQLIGFGREAQPITGDGWPVLLNALSRSLGLKKPPVLLKSPRGLTPMTWGVRRPVVLLPSHCDQWTREQRREILLHELAHIRRRDCLTQFTAQLVCLVYWFNPLVWIAARQMRVERERACDDQVLVAGIRPSSYARHLLEIAANIGTAERTLSTGLAMARRSRIFERLDALLDPELPRQAPNRSRTLLAGALAVVVLLPLAVLDPVAKADGPRRRKADVAARLGRGPNPFLVRWRGDIDLTMDGRAISWMSDEAFLFFEQTVHGGRRELLIEPGPDHKPSYGYKVDHRNREFDRKASDWLAEMLAEVSVNGELRVPDLPPVRIVPEPRYVHQLALGGINTGERLSWSIHQDGARMEMHLRGGIEFSPDNRAVLSMAKDAVLELEKQAGSRQVSFKIQPDGDGRPVPKVKVGYRSMPFDDQAAAELANTLELVLMGLGHHADVLVRRAYQAGGSHAVLTLIDRIESPSSRSIYYGEAFTLTGLDEKELIQILGRLADDIDSDYSKACALAAFVRARELNGTAYPAFLACLASMDSDYEKGGVLQTALGRDDLTHEAAIAALAALEQVGSDYQAARALSALDPELLRDVGLGRAYVTAIARITSDHEKGSVLSDLARYAQDDPELLEVCLEAAGTIRSPVQASRVMTRLGLDPRSPATPSSSAMRGREAPPRRDIPLRN